MRQSQLDVTHCALELAAVFDIFCAEQAVFAPAFEFCLHIGDPGLQQADGSLVEPQPLAEVNLLGLIQTFKTFGNVHQQFVGGCQPVCTVKVNTVGDGGVFNPAAPFAQPHVVQIGVKPLHAAGNAFGGTAVILGGNRQSLKLFNRQSGVLRQKRHFFAQRSKCQRPIKQSGEPGHRSQSFEHFVGHRDKAVAHFVGFLGGSLGFGADFFQPVGLEFEKKGFKQAHFFIFAFCMASCEISHSLYLGTISASHNIKASSSV